MKTNKILQRIEAGRRNPQYNIQKPTHYLYHNTIMEFNHIKVACSSYQLLACREDHKDTQNIAHLHCYHLRRYSSQSAFLLQRLPTKLI